MLTQEKQRKAAREFAARWDGIGYEKGDSARFWMSLLNEVYGVEKPADFIRFEDQVKIDRTSFIDGFIPSTHVLIEQKSINRDLKKGLRQSDGSILSPLQQAKRYSIELPYSDRPRWIVLSNFKEFHIYDMQKPGGDPDIVKLKELENDYYRMFFLVDKEDQNTKKEVEASIKAGELVGVLYDALLKQYAPPHSDEILKDLNILCVRLVFCFYAEDAGLLGRHSMFHDYLAKYPQFHFRDALIKLFRVLDQRPEERDPYLEDELAAFPYVNGGLFEKENIVIPRINEEIIDIILNKTSANFDWSKISPTIFGGVFESTLNPETRRSGGMHYTSIENIHKVIDPLFLNELNQELDEITAIKIERTKNKRLEEFQEKLASLTFMDPAAGSGNFLTETYISLRKMENAVMECKYGKQENGEQRLQIRMGEVFNPIKVSINQFYGIEINDFAVSVARTALWIAESQMMKETENIFNHHIDFLPLKSYANIIEGNALTMDWEKVVSNKRLDYCMGNPPFLGYSLQSRQQKTEIREIFVDKMGKPLNSAGKIDYVSAWYMKAARYIQSTSIQVAFVSTNSIVQGEQVPSIWQPLIDDYNIEINFAHKPFRWDSEASNKARVHVVIIGFSHGSSDRKKILYENSMTKQVSTINAYLAEAPNVFITSRNKPISDIPEMTTGNRPADGGHLIIEADNYLEFITKEPGAIPYIKRLTGSEEYINNRERYCLWLVDVSPSEIRKMPEIMKRVEACRLDRLSGAPDRQKLAETPTLFRETKNPTEFILIPLVSSETRKYIPMGFLDGNYIVTNLAGIIPDGSIYDLGILISNVHMSWMRAVAGRLESRYRYSKNIVYNNFPWPSPSKIQRERIESTAKMILEARELYPDCSLADLYNDIVMPPELRKAHQENDKAVMEAYGFNWRIMSESDCVAELMKLYTAHIKNI